MRTNKEKNEQTQKRILARLMAKEIPAEQLKKITAASGTCSTNSDTDASQV